MDSKGLLKRREQGSILVEACVAMLIMILAAQYVLVSTNSAMWTTQFAIQEQLVDNFLENQAAAVRVATMAPGGALTMPGFSTLAFGTAAVTTNDVALSPGAPSFTANITTIRRSASPINGQETWEYVIQANFPRRLPNSTTENYQKSKTIFRSLPQQ